jgi:phosphoglycerate dehydrogenase-like enzyme
VNTTRTNWDYIFSDNAKAGLCAIAEVDESRIPSEPDESQVARSVEGADVIVGGWGAVPLSTPVLASCPDARIFIYGAGSLKHLLTDASRERGLRLTTASHVNAEPVAQFTLGLVLVALKDVIVLNQALSERGPQAWSVDKQNYPRGYNGSRVGLVGYGEVSKQLLKLLQHFDLRVCVADPYVTSDDARRYGFTPVQLAELVRSCDVVSIHAADVPENENMISAELIRSMKVGSTLINTARGRLVEEDALVERLRTGEITAFLDVTYPEPPEPGHPFYTLANCILTPHMAGSVGRESERLGDYCVRELENWIAGRPLEHEIGLESLASRA